MATLCKISLVKYNKAISKYENDVIIVLRYFINYSIFYKLNKYVRLNLKTTFTSYIHRGCEIKPLVKCISYKLYV